MSDHSVEDKDGKYNFTNRTQVVSGPSLYSDLAELSFKGESGNEDIGVIYESVPNTEIRLLVLDDANIR